LIINELRIIEFFSFHCIPIIYTFARQLFTTCLAMATLYYKFRSTKNKGYLTARFQYRIELDEKSKDIYFDARLEDPRFYVDKEYFSKTYKDPILREKEKNSKNLERRKVASDLDSEENRLRNLVIDQFNKVKDPESLTQEWFKDIINEYLHPGLKKKESSVKVKDNHLITVMEHYTSYKSSLTVNTIKKMGVVKSKLERYEQDFKTKLKITDINTDFRDQFVKWSQDNHYASGTISRDLTFLRTICYYASNELDLEIYSKIERVKAKAEKIKNPFTDNRDNPEEILEVYLTPVEIAEIEKNDELPEYLANARDIFLIGYETGQRISDYLRFDKEMLKTINGVTLINFIQKKTRKQMLLPLSSRVLKILEKRNGEFPRRISDQKFNDYIKLVCKESKITETTLGVKRIKVLKDSNDEESEIWRGIPGYYPKYELIAGHTARRSFCTNHYGIWPTSDIMYFSGHSTETMLLQYIKAKPIERALQIFKNLN